MRQIHEHCQKRGLAIPFFSDEDLDKSLWRLIKEQSLTLANLQPHVIVTESPLFNQETLVSGSLETFGNDNYDLKNILISENDNLTPITRLLLKFPARSTSVVNTVQLPQEKSGWQVAGFYSVLRQFNKIWRDDVTVNVSEVEKDGSFVHVLQASTSNPEKLALLRQEVENMNKQVVDELGVDIKCTTEIRDQNDSTPFLEFKASPNTNKLFFTGKKIQLLFMMQALQSYVSQELGSLSEATFSLDYVDDVDLEK